MATTLNKNEKQIAEAMNEYHWRAWLSVDALSTDLNKRAGNLQNSLVDLAKRKVVEKKQIKEDLCFRLTPGGRRLLGM